MAKIKTLKTEDVLNLRWRVLRKGRDFDTAKNPSDDADDTIHLGIVANNGNVLAVLTLADEALDVSLQIKQIRLRGMAVDENHHGKGYGTILINFGISMLKSKGVGLLWCNARTSALEFYLKQGFVAVGEEFEIPDVGPHYQMMLKL